MSVRKFKEGDSAFFNEKMPIYIKNKGINPGTEVKIVQYHSYGSEYTGLTQNGFKFRVKSSCLDKITPQSSKEEIENVIEKAKENISKQENIIKEAQLKLSYMNEVGSDVFEENEFKAYQTLTIIEQGGMSKIEKARAIAALIKS